MAIADVPQQLGETQIVSPKEKRRFTFPTAYTVLALLLILVAVLTFVIPAGRYDTAPTGEPIPGTYHPVEANPQRLLDIFLGPINGMYGIEDRSGNINIYNSGSLYGAIDVALFILMIGGFLGIVMKTGAIDAGIASVVQRLGTKGRYLIIILMIVFAAGGTTYGMAEESLAFYPLIIAALIVLGYDALTGVAVIMLGAGIGTMGSTLNPFATGIATGFAGITLTEGIIYRLLILVGGLVLGIWWVMRYAERVRKDPAKSVVADMKQANEERFGNANQTEMPKLDGRRKLVLVLFLLSFVIMIVGVIPWADLGINRIATRYWWFAEMSALFLIMGIIIGIVYRMKEQTLVNNFIDGARDMVGVALVVALARGISVIMTNGLIIDTVLNWCERTLAGLGGVAFINVIYLLYLPLSFLIPSSSGLATVTMPIMAPLASFAGVPEHLIVTAYQSASGLLNLFTPTSAVVVGGLLIGRVPISSWWKYIVPLLIMFMVMTMVVLSLGVIVGS